MNDADILPAPRIADASDALHSWLRSHLAVPTKARMWGVEGTFTPPLSRAVYGDGGAILCVCDRRARPAFWQVRIDSKWRIGTEPGRDHAALDLGKAIREIAANLAAEFAPLDTEVEAAEEKAQQADDEIDWMRDCDPEAAFMDPGLPRDAHGNLAIDISDGVMFWRGGATAAPTAVRHCAFGEAGVGELDVMHHGIVEPVRIGGVLVMPRVADASEAEHLRLQALLCAPREGRLWEHSRPVKFTPALSRAVYGDGKGLIGITTISDRPRYWLVRIDSQWMVPGRSCDAERRLPPDAPDVGEAMEGIEVNLIAEFGSSDPEAYLDDEIADCDDCCGRGCDACAHTGYGPEGTPPDFPAIDLTDGTSWWREDYPAPSADARPRKARLPAPAV